MVRTRSRPTTVVASIEMGERYQYGSAMREGLALLTAVQEGFPDDTEVMSAMARARYGERRFTESVALLEAAIAREPDRADHHLYLGSAYAALGRTSEAIKRFERAIELDPGREDAYRNLATLFDTMKRPERAKEIIRNLDEFLLGSCCGR